MMCVMRPGQAYCTNNQCDSTVLQLGVGPGRRLVFERPRNGGRATLSVDKYRVAQAQAVVDRIARRERRYDKINIERVAQAQAAQAGVDRIARTAIRLTRHCVVIPVLYNTYFLFAIGIVVSFV